MNHTTKKYIVYGILLALFYVICWRLNLLIYGILFTLPIIVFCYVGAKLGWQKPMALGLFLCFLWFLSNVLTFFFLAPVSDIGINIAFSEIVSDLIRYPEIINKAITYDLYKMRLVFSLVMLGGLTFVIVNTPTGRGLGLHRLFEVPGGITFSKFNTMGSARWATETEMRNYFNSQGPGLILGKNENNEPYILPYTNEKFDYQRNQNIIVFGATGSGKTASFVKPNVLQADTSYVITDPKMEIYKELAPFLRNQGYDVYKLNLVDMNDSERWNPFLNKDNTCDLTTQDAILIASSIIKNTKDPSEKNSDPFWEKSEQALLTALIMYAIRKFKNEKKTFADILRWATGRTASAIDYDFGKLPPSDPARAAFNVYSQAPDKVRGSIIVSLATRLQLYQSEELANLTSASDFDLEELGKKKTAIFVILSDYDETFHSISALFFTQAFQKLYRLASANQGRLPQFTRFLMDEFCNIGYLPGFTTKLSTMRSRGISAQMIVQSLGQLQNRYPFGQSDEIIGNCDTKYMMGANDAATAKYIVELLGKSTVEQETRGRSDRVVIDAGHISKREFGRELMTPDEILRLDNREGILIIRGTYPAKIKKLFYMEHPNAHKITKLAPTLSLSKTSSIEEELYQAIKNSIPIDNYLEEDYEDTQSEPDEQFQP